MRGRPSRFQHNGLIDLRKRAGLTQMCAAVRCGVSQVVFYTWEISARPIPAARIADVARVLGCSVDEVVAATVVAEEPHQRATPAPAPRWVDPADPEGWRYTDDESRDAQARFSAWMEREAELVVTAAQVRFKARYGVHRRSA